MAATALQPMTDTTASGNAPSTPAAPLTHVFHRISYGGKQGVFKLHPAALGWRSPPIAIQANLIRGAMWTQLSCKTFLLQVILLFL